MAAYAYPIIIKRNPQRIDYQETKEFDQTCFTLAELSFVGKDSFFITEDDWGGSTVTVYRSRLETKEELKSRVDREESYMREYNRRKSI